MRIHFSHAGWPILVVLTALLLWACNAVPPKALFLDSAAWPEILEQIALVEVSYDRRYRPPPGLDLTTEVRQALKQELAGKGYRLILADQGGEIYHSEASAAELTARAPQEADAVLTLHIDFLFLPTSLRERNPPPEAEIAGEARLVSKVGSQELWRGRGNGQAGGAASMPVVFAMNLRQEALTNLMSRLFASLPDKR